MVDFRAFWNHPAGPKTIHFWAPAMKWGLVVAGLSDLKRPADKISVSQNAGILHIIDTILIPVALTATGVIWARYSTQIIPTNYSLMTVNIFVAGSGIYQLFRAWQYHKSIDNILYILYCRYRQEHPK